MNPFRTSRIAITKNSMEPDTPCESEEEIPIQSRMLTVCDIYDALTAKDRPYKAAVPVDRALAILEDEVKQGKLDAQLFKLFLEAKVYQLPATGAPAKKVA